MTTKTTTTAAPANANMISIEQVDAQLSAIKGFEKQINAIARANDALAAMQGDELAQAVSASLLPIVNNPAVSATRAQSKALRGIKRQIEAFYAASAPAESENGAATEPAPAPAKK